MGDTDTDMGSTDTLDTVMALDMDMVCLMAMDTDMDTDMVFMDTLDTVMALDMDTLTMARGPLMLMPPLLLLQPLTLTLMLTTATTAMDTDMGCLMAMDTAITMARGLLMLMLMLMLTTATTVMDTVMDTDMVFMDTVVDTDMAMVDTPTTDNLFLPKRDPYSTTIYNHCYTWSHGIHPDLSVNHQSCNSCKNWLFQFVILLHQC